jgi:hypothetical protein
MSQSEEEEFRKMAEIADAINDILENNKLDDGSDASPEDISVSEDTENQDTNTHVLSEEVTSDNLDEGLEATLSAEIAADTSGNASIYESEDTQSDTPLTETDVPFISGAAFDTPPNQDNLAALDSHNTTDENDAESMTDPLSAADNLETTADEPFDKFLDNDMAFLSLRMRDTLAELKSEHGDTLEATENLIGKMALSLDGLVEEMHSSLGALEKKITSRKATINQEIDRIYQEIATTRSELELLVSKFQNNTAENHKTYNDIFSEERSRVERYREFLSFMIRDKK